MSDDKLPEVVTLDWLGRRMIALQSAQTAMGEDVRVIRQQLRRIEDRAERIDETCGRYFING